MDRTYVMKKALATGVLATMLFAAAAAMGQQTSTRPGQRGPVLRPQEQAGPPAREPARPTAVRPTTRVGAGAGVEVVSGAPRSPLTRVSAPQEAFEPTLMRPVEYGPVPPTDEKATISLTGQMSASEFLDALSIATGWNIATSPSLRGDGAPALEFWTNEVSPRQALAILRFNDIYYEFDREANFLFVMTVDEHLERRYGSLVHEEFVIRHADMQSVEVVLQSLLSARGRLIADPSTSKIIVYDTQDNLDYMRRTVQQIDAPRDTRAYQLVNADAEALSSSVEALLTEGGRLNVDARSNTLVVSDRPDRLERIAEVIGLLDQELETRTWVLDYADPVAVGEFVAELVPEAMGSIVVNEPVHQITVTATPYRLNQIDQRISAWDEKRRQVQIEAYLATAGRDIMRDLAINWSYSTTIGGDPISIAVGTLTSGGGDGGDGDGDGPTNVAGTTIDFQSDRLRTIINALDTSSDANILAQPRITVQDGEEAIFENTTRVPFASSTTTFGNLNNAVNTNTQIDFIDVGTILRVIPRITTEDSILMTIDAEDSTFVEVEIFANGELNTLPQKTQNRAQTQVLVQHEETIVLGGLRTSNFRDSVDRVPILGDLPIIGRAFRTTEKDHQDRELLIFLTPTIVGATTVPEAVKLATFEAEMGQTMRRDSKTAFGRFADKLSRGENEFFVSIGQTGGILAEGEPATFETLSQRIREIERPAGKTLIIREHPRAPQWIAADIAEIAMEQGIQVDFDRRRAPFVPHEPAELEIAEPSRD